MYRRRNKNKKSVEDSQHWNIYGKPKKKAKYEVVFDDASRNDYLNNFHQRKIERRNKANSEKKAKDKEARSLEKQQRRDHMAKAIQEMSGKGELEDALKEIIPADADDDDESENENNVDEVFESVENNNTTTAETVVQYNAPGVVVTAITSAVIDEEEEVNIIPAASGRSSASTATTVPPVKASVKTKNSSPWASNEEVKKSKSEIRKINANKKRKSPSGGNKFNKKHPNKKFKK